METLPNKPKQPKPTIGYCGYETATIGDYCHYWIDFLMIRKIDLLGTLKSVAESGDAMRHERIASLVRLAKNRAVYVADDMAYVMRQTNPQDRWYSPSISLLGHRWGGKTRKDIPAPNAESFNAPQPQSLIESLVEALGAVKIAALQGNAGGLIRVDGSIAYVVDDSPVEENKS